MDDMTAFERQVTRDALRDVGPVRPVDDAAIFTAITATQSPKWRFQSMFSATKFVVAGAIVALFGGFLLSGVPTQQRDEVTPAAVSPSATADLLSTLDTEEVAPGVFRVLSDGYRGLDENVSYVASTPEGDIWVLKQDRVGKDVRIVRVGQPGVAYRPEGSTEKEIFGARLVTDDGTIGYAQGGYDVPAVLESGEWVTNKGSNYDDCVRLFGGVATDGTCFDSEDYASPRILGEDGSVSQSAFGRNSLYGLDIYLGKPVSRDGIVWQPAFGLGSGTPANTFEGLARYDGESWAGVPYPEEDARPVSGPLAVAPDGVVWVPSYAADDHTR